jgi:hypothetical protein
LAIDEEVRSGQSLDKKLIELYGAMWKETKWRKKVMNECRKEKNG